MITILLLRGSERDRARERINEVIFIISKQVENTERIKIPICQQLEKRNN